MLKNSLSHLFLNVDGLKWWIGIAVGVQGGYLCPSNYYWSSYFFLFFRSRNSYFPIFLSNHAAWHPDSEKTMEENIANVMEGFTRSRLIAQIAKNLDPRQYAREGHSTTDALIYLLQAIHEAIDSGNCGARIFFADFSKGFDLIDHNILLEELYHLNAHPVLINWIKAFLTNRKQAVRIGNSLSDWKSPNGGIPQGTKLGVILFAAMTNNLLRNWHLRIKFVDDTTALEIDSRQRSDWVTWRPNKICLFSLNKSNHCRSKLTSFGNFCRLCPVFAWISTILNDTTFNQRDELRRKIRRYSAAMTSGSCCVPPLTSRSKDGVFEGDGFRPFIELLRWPRRVTLLN